MVILKRDKLIIKLEGRLSEVISLLIEIKKGQEKPRPRPRHLKLVKKDTDKLNK